MGEGRAQKETKISISNQAALKKKIPFYLRNRLCVRAIARRAVIKESIM